ncbi:MAG: dTDP-glucose 4,6-dehydratase [Cyanobacteria bacterium J06635_15]
MLNPTNLLVTGGAGFIGASFTRYWQQRYDTKKLVVLDALTYAGNRERLEEPGSSKPILLIEGNICDRALIDTLLQMHTIDTIVHFAAESHVDRSILGPAPFIQTNLVGTFTLLEAFRCYWQAQEQPGHFRFLQVSTDEVYGSLGAEDPPFTEKTSYAPNSPYAASKAGSDHLVQAYHHTYGLPTLITNCSNNYGPYQHPEKLIPLMAVNVLMGKPLPVYGDGQNIRDWLYVEDHCEALDQVLHRGLPGATYNIGGNFEIRNLDLVMLLCDLMDELVPDLPVSPAKGLITFVEDRPGHDCRYAIDITKIHRELGWSPKTPFQEGLWRSLQWYIDHVNWWRPLLSDDYQQFYNQRYGNRLGGND